MRVTNDSGLTATAGTTIAVDGRAPAAVLSVPATAVVGQTVMLDASGSSDADPGDRISFAWDTGQGAFATPNVAVLQLTPSKAGDITVRVKVTDSTGSSAIASATIAVTATSVAVPTGPAAPVATTASAIAKVLAAKIVSVKQTKAGTTLVTLACPATSPACRGRATVSVGRRSRSMPYAVAAGKRYTVAIRPPVRLRRGRAKAAKLRVVDESGTTLTRSVKLRRSR